MLPEGTDITPVEPVLEPPPPRPEREPFWGYDDLAIVLGLLFASIVVIVLGAGLFAVFNPKVRDDPTPLLLPTQVLLYGFIYLCFRLVLGIRYGRPVFRSLGWRRSNFNLGVAAVGGAVLAFGVAGLAALLHTPKVPSPIDKLASSPVSLALFGVMAVTIAPLFEELFFRGFIQPLLSRTFGVIAGVLLTAALFGALHAPEYSWAWQYAAAVSVAGAIFGWIRARTNSIIPSTIMHGCYNLVFVIALAVTKHT
jgi:membrane protease YdiL (CAAX protease family)